MIAKLITFYYNYFIDNADGYLLLSSAVCLNIMSSQYHKWVDNKEVEPIESLSPELKLKYWNLAIKYHTDKEKRLLASITGYALDLMTGK